VSAPVPRRLGVLGGTFDPVHVGHLAIARHGRAALDLERVLLVPAAIPPHKIDRVLTPASDRLAMVELAVAGDPFLESSRIDIDRSGPSYSVDTMALLADAERASGRDPDLYFILSSEAVVGLPGWREPARLLSICRLAVVPRGETAMPGPDWIAEHFPGRADRFVAIDGPRVEVSASEIRRIAAAGGSLRGLVPPAVERYIVEHGLYTRDVWRAS
jgi:nicotinate-nucleotide adenylyltransferase